MEDPRWLLRPIILGVIMGGVFAAVEVLTPPRLPDELIVAVYAAVLILVSAAFVSSIMSGLVFGVVALVTRTFADLLFTASSYGIGLALAVVPYSLLLLYGLVVFPAAGAVGAYLGRKMGIKSEDRRIGVAKKGRVRAKSSTRQ